MVANGIKGAAMRCNDESEHYISLLSLPRSINDTLDLYCHPQFGANMSEKFDSLFVL